MTRDRKIQEECHPGESRDPVRKIEFKILSQALDPGFRRDDVV